MSANLSSSRVVGSTLVSAFPALEQQLEAQVGALLGIPLDLAVANAGFLYDATGLKQIIAQPGADPTIAGAIGRVGNLIKVNDGVVARTNQVIDSFGQVGNINNTVAESNLYNQTIPAGYLGLRNKVQLQLYSRFGLLAGNIVTIKCYYGGVLGPTIAIGNSSVATANLTLCPITVTLAGNLATNVQVLQVECHITNNTNTAFDAFSSVISNLCQVAGMGIDSTVNQFLQVNIVFSNASVSNQADHLGGLLWLAG